MPPAAEVPRTRRQFSPAVRNYVKRSFAPENEISCVSNSELEEKLREVLTKAAENHELDVIDWERQALPQVMIQDERSKILSNNNTEVSSQKSPSSDDSRKRNLADHSQDRHQRIDSQRYDVIDIPSLNREPPGGPHTLIDPHASTRAPARDFRDVQDQDQGRRDMDRNWTVGELQLAVEDLLSGRTPVQHTRRASTTSGRSAANSRNISDHSEPGPVISDQCKNIEAIDQQPAPIAPQVPDFDSPERLGTDNDGDLVSGQSPRTFPGPGKLHSTMPLTDSGHASISYDKFANRAMLPEKEHSAELLNDSQNIPSGEEVPAPADAQFTSKNAEDEDDNDAQSIYTVEPKISSVKHKDFISKVANDLFEKVILEENAHRTPEIIQGVVPRLLKGFALRAGQSGLTQMQRDLMVFIRRHRREIAGSLRMKYLENEGDSQIPEYDDDRMDLDEIMNLWHQNLEDAGFEVDTPQKEIDSASETASSREDVFTEDSGSEIPEFATYKRLISNSSAYHWLLGTINRNLYLNPAEPNSQAAIRQRILDSLPSSRIVSRHDQPTIYQVTFILNWDPMAFMKKKGYDESMNDIMRNSITITGSSHDAQAMLSSQYLRQTWHSYGADMLQLIEDAIFSKSDSQCKCTLPDNTKLTAWTHEGTFRVEVTGIEDSITEIGEQLAWIGSAIRLSPHDSKISYCTPFVSSASVEDTPNLPAESPSIVRSSCVIDFKFSDDEQKRHPSLPGQCWHGLFRNAVVVMGFPIPHRSRQGTGPEISLYLMIYLLQTDRLNPSQDGIFINGFSSLLALTEYIRDKNEILWHLFYKADGSRISYWDDIKGPAPDVVLADLGTSRHFVA